MLNRILYVAAPVGLPSCHIGMTIYTTNLSFVRILSAILSAISIGIKLLAPARKQFQVRQFQNGITLHADGIPGYVKGDDGGALVDDIRSPDNVERRTNLSKSNESSMDTLLLNSKRGTQENMKAVLTENGESLVFQQEQNLQGDQGSNPQCELVGNVCSESPIVSSVKHDQNKNEQQSIENNRSSASVPKDGASVSDVSSNVCPSSPCFQTNLVPPRSSVCNKAAKSKLNPGAKILRPSISHHHRAINPPPVHTTAYVPESSHVVHLATVEPEVKISPYARRSSVPIKLSQCNNMVA